MSKLGWKATPKQILALNKGREISRSSLISRKKRSEKMLGSKNRNYKRIFSKEERENMSKAQLGKKHSEESKLKMSLSKKGQIPWNKGKRGVKTSNKGKLAWNRGLKGVCYKTKEMRERMREIALAKKYGQWMNGKNLSEETKKKIGLGNSNPTMESRRRYSEAKKGSNNPRWISDRTKLQRYQDESKDRRSSTYNNWRKEVWLRDNFKCKIANPDCSGRIEVHHILNWKDYPELRYQINNGITLCHAHHPRKRVDEAKLSPYFQKLVAEMN